MHPVEYKVAGQRRPIDKSSGRRIVAGVVALSAAESRRIGAEYERDSYS